MSNILSEIVESKRAEVTAAAAARPLDDLRRQVADAPAPRCFFTALTEPAGKLRVIAEVKKASPSAGLIREDFDPVAIATAYEQNGAAAVSCLTDEKYFQGSLTYLTQIRSAILLPVLRKDFLIDVYQVYEARAAGADAVLLIAECLSIDTMKELLELTGELGMTALVEIYEPSNLQPVQQLLEDTPGTKSLLGINNRNLKIMKTDLAHTIDLLGQVHDRSRLVSESGIRTPADVARLRDVDVHRILVGEHLMRQPDVGAALRELMSGGA